MANPQQIESTYSAALEAAQPFQDSDPETYNTRVRAAESRRSEAYRDMAMESDRRASAAVLDNARAEALRQFPLAIPSMVTGDTVEAINANAKAMHDHVAAQRSEAEATARAASRSARSGVYAQGVPGSEARNQTGESQIQNDTRQALGNLHELRQEAQKPGDKRGAPVMNEMETVAALRASGKMAGLSIENMIAKTGGGSPASDEDRVG